MPSDHRVQALVGRELTEEPRRIRLKSVDPPRRQTDSESEVCVGTFSLVSTPGTSEVCSRDQQKRVQRGDSFWEPQPLPGKMVSQGVLSRPGQEDCSSDISHEPVKPRRCSSPVADCRSEISYEPVKPRRCSSPGNDKADLAPVSPPRDRSSDRGARRSSAPPQQRNSDRPSQPAGGRASQAEGTQSAGRPVAGKDLSECDRPEGCPGSASDTDRSELWINGKRGSHVSEQARSGSQIHRSQSEQQGSRQSHQQLEARTPRASQKSQLLLVPSESEACTTEQASDVGTDVLPTLLRSQQHAEATAAPSSRASREASMVDKKVYESTPLHRSASVGPVMDAPDPTQSRRRTFEGSQGSIRDFTGKAASQDDSSQGLPAHQSAVRSSHQGSLRGNAQETPSEVEQHGQGSHHSERGPQPPSRQGSVHLPLQAPDSEAEYRPLVSSRGTPLTTMLYDLPEDGSLSSGPPGYSAEDDLASRQSRQSTKTPMAHSRLGSVRAGQEMPSEAEGTSERSRRSEQRGRHSVSVCDDVVLERPSEASPRHSVKTAQTLPLRHGSTLSAAEVVNQTPSEAEYYSRGSRQSAKTAQAQPSLRHGSTVNAGDVVQQTPSEAEYYSRGSRQSTKTAPAQPSLRRGSTVNAGDVVQQTPSEAEYYSQGHSRNNQPVCDQGSRHSVKSSQAQRASRDGSIVNAGDVVLQTPSEAEHEGQCSRNSNRRASSASRRGSAVNAPSEAELCSRFSRHSNETPPASPSPRGSSTGAGNAGDEALQTPSEAEYYSQHSHHSSKTAPLASRHSVASKAAESVQQTPRNTDSYRRSSKTGEAVLQTPSEEPHRPSSCGSAKAAAELDYSTSEEDCHSPRTCSSDRPFAQAPAAHDSDPESESPGEAVSDEDGGRKRNSSQSTHASSRDGGSQEHCEARGNESEDIQEQHSDSDASDPSDSEDEDSGGSQRDVQHNTLGLSNTRRDRAQKKILRRYERRNKDRTELSGIIEGSREGQSSRSLPAHPTLSTENRRSSPSLLNEAKRSRSLDSRRSHASLADEGLPAPLQSGDRLSSSPLLEEAITQEQSGLANASRRSSRPRHEEEEQQPRKSSLRLPTETASGRSHHPVHEDEEEQQPRKSSLRLPIETASGRSHHPVHEDEDEALEQTGSSSIRHSRTVSRELVPVQHVQSREGELQHVIKQNTGSEPDTATEDSAPASAKGSWTSQRSESDSESSRPRSLMSLERREHEAAAKAAAAAAAASQKFKAVRVAETPSMLSEDDQDKDEETHDQASEPSGYITQNAKEGPFERRGLETYSECNSEQHVDASLNTQSGYKRADCRFTAPGCSLHVGVDVCPPSRITFEDFAMASLGGEERNRSLLLVEQAERVLAPIRESRCAPADTAALALPGLLGDLVSTFTLHMRGLLEPSGATTINGVPTALALLVPLVEVLDVLIAPEEDPLAHPKERRRSVRGGEATDLISGRGERSVNAVAALGAGLGPRGFLPPCLDLLGEGPVFQQLQQHGALELAQELSLHAALAVRLVLGWTPPLAVPRPCDVLLSVGGHPKLLESASASLQKLRDLPRTAKAEGAVVLGRLALVLDALRLGLRSDTCVDKLLSGRHGGSHSNRSRRRNEKECQDPIAPLAPLAVDALEQTTAQKGSQTSVATLAMAAAAVRLLAVVVELPSDAGPSPPKRVAGSLKRLFETQPLSLPLTAAVRHLVCCRRNTRGWFGDYGKSFHKSLRSALAAEDVPRECVHAALRGLSDGHFRKQLASGEYAHSVRAEAAACGKRYVLLATLYENVEAIACCVHGPSATSGEDLADLKTLCEERSEDEVPAPRKSLPGHLGNLRSRIRETCLAPYVK